MCSVTGRTGDLYVPVSIANGLNMVNVNTTNAGGPTGASGAVLLRSNNAWKFRDC